MNFSRAEFACGCGCGFAAVDYELLACLETIRAHFAKPVRINSACRCASHNLAVGGEPASKHLHGMAADFVVVGVSPAKVHQFMVGVWPEQYGMGMYKTWCHLDVRSNKARWEK